MGFSIGYDVLGYAPWIPHYGTIVVGDSNRIGNYACLHTSTCITSTSKRIGNALFLATGTKLTNVQELGNNIQIGANSVVNKNFGEDSIMIAGAPAIKRKNCYSWYIDTEYEDRVRQIENLKKKMFKTQ